jgi:hypothetical protein
LSCRAFFAGWVLVQSACLPEASFPGAEVMGTFRFQAQAWSSDCVGISDLPDGGFPFGGTFSRTQGQSQAWFTLGERSQEATFDGQLFSSTRTAARSFLDCECDEQVQLVETLSVALVSRSQNRVLEGGCPERPLDGGMPGADPDAGVFLPSSTEKGFDAVRACGELVDQLVPGPGCRCVGCTLRYTVQGDRE